MPNVKFSQSLGLPGESLGLPGRHLDGLPPLTLGYYKPSENQGFRAILGCSLNPKGGGYRHKSVQFLCGIVLASALGRACVGAVPPRWVGTAQAGGVGI